MCTSSFEKVVSSLMEFMYSVIHCGKNILELQVFLEGFFVSIKPRQSLSDFRICSEKCLEYISMLARKLLGIRQQQ